MALERRGWLRLQESAHAVPKDIPVAERADTAADFSLLGATMMYSSLIAKLRRTRNIVSEGYLLGDLTYAKIRYELGMSDAYPDMVTMVKRVLREPYMRPDLYILLKAGPETIRLRQRDKDERERNLTEFWRTRYYTANAEIHREMEAENIAAVETDADTEVTLGSILQVIERRRVMSA
jgi:thymidylate kinase